MKGPAGENGVPGRSISEDEVREMCFNVLRSHLEVLTANLQGPPGYLKLFNEIYLFR